MSEKIMLKHFIVFMTVRPRWTVEPTDKQFAQGSDAKVDCKADGFPQPSISWKKAVGKFNKNLVFRFLVEPICLVLFLHLHFNMLGERHPGRWVGRSCLQLQQCSMGVCKSKVGS